MKKIIFCLPVMACIMAACSKIDNYDAPDGGIYGKLIDKITGEGLQTELPNGFNVKLFQKGSSKNSPIVVPGKPDGSFENSFIFQYEYAVLPTEGAFFPVDSAKVQVGKRTEANFEVMPFLAVTNVNVVATKDSVGRIQASYKIVRQQTGDKIVERKTLVSKIPTCSNAVSDYRAQTDLARTPDSVVLAGQYSDVVSGLLSGKTYYVRVAVRTNNPLKKYNYSKTFQVTIP